jgi:hypothetical protein
MYVHVAIAVVAAAATTEDRTLSQMVWFSYWTYVIPGDGRLPPSGIPGRRIRHNEYRVRLLYLWGYRFGHICRRVLRATKRSRKRENDARKHCDRYVAVELVQSKDMREAAKRVRKGFARRHVFRTTDA